MLTLAFTAGSVYLVLLTLPCLYRAHLGPSVIDRVLAISVIGTKTIVIMALVAFIYGNDYFLDVAIVYALISFVATIGVAKYLETGKLG